MPRSISRTLRQGRRPDRRRELRSSLAPATGQHRAGSRSGARPIGSLTPPGANFGTRNGHLRPGARRGLDDQPVGVAVDLAQPRVDVAEADRVGRVARRSSSAARITSGSAPTPSSSTLITASAPASCGGDRDVHRRRPRPPGRAGPRSRPAAGRPGTARRPAAPRAPPQRDPQPLAEAGLLEDEVALGVAQLVGQRGVLTAAAQRVAGEVGELEQQLAGPVGVGAHERRDGGERVVDEVRADLRPQRPQLGLHQPGALRFGAGESRSGRTPSGRPPRPPARASPMCRGRRRRSAPDDGVAVDERGGNRRSAPGSPARRRRRSREHASCGPTARPRGVLDRRVGVRVRRSPPGRRRAARGSTSATAGGARAAPAGAAPPAPRRAGSSPRAAPARPGSRCAACRTWRGRPRCRGHGAGSAR